jgi:hypothetical protein
MCRYHDAVCSNVVSGNLEFNEPMSRTELEERMDELARKYVEARDPEIPAEMCKLARELEKLEKTSSD